jgi:hypothetical protein
MKFKCGYEGCDYVIEEKEISFVDKPNEKWIPENELNKGTLLYLYHVITKHGVPDMKPLDKKGE